MSEASISGWRWWDDLLRDVRFGARMMRRAPAFTLTAIGVLAIGVGTNIAAFQILNSVALTPLPVRDPDSLVRFNLRTTQRSSSTMPYAAFAFYATHNTVLDASIALLRTSVALEPDGSRRVATQFVTPNYFSELGAVAAVGRLLDPVLDDAADAEPVVVVSSSLGQSRFGSDAAVVGRPVRINGQRFTIVGVTSASFAGLTGRSAQVWIPIRQHPYAFPGSGLLTNQADNSIAFFGRMKAGLNLRGVEAGMRPAAATFAQVRSSESPQSEWLRAVPAGRFISMDLDGIAIAGAFTLLVLVAACANLATLVLARGFAREREIAVRLSVGASRFRLVRQLLTESVMLAALGTTAALGLSVVASRLVMSATGAPEFLYPKLDVRVALFAVAMAALAACFSGLAPALQAVKPRAARGRARGILVATQVAAGCTLLVVSSLLVRALGHVTHAPLGFEYEHHLVVDPDLNGSGFKPAAAQIYWNGLRDQLTAMPGVAGISLGTVQPLGSGGPSTRIGDGHSAIVHYIDPAYFTVMGIPLRRGRIFNANEPEAAVVSESFAQALWPGEDPLGKIWDRSTVIGVVGSAPTVSLADPSRAEFYHLLDAEHMPRAVLIVRVAGDPSSRTGVVAGAAGAVNPRVPVSVVVLQEAFDATLRRPQQMSVIVSSLSGLTLALAAVGLGGLVIYTVSQRAREIGIRLALGARRRDVIAATVRQFGSPIGWGLASGLLCAAGLSKVLEEQLFGMSPFDPISYLAAAVVFLVVAALASAVPLRRALKVDPLQTLKCE
jgi:predicted permease